MATIGSLVVSLTLQSAAFLRSISAASAATARATSQMQTSLQKLQGGFALAGRSIAAFVSVRALSEGISTVADYADAWKLATNQVAAANAISTHQARSMEGINAIAIKTRTSLAETAELYGKLLRSTNDVASSEEEVARATELVNKAFKAGGASIQEQVNGIRQLAQSLASGIFQGDELRSIRENAPLLAKAIADEFNTTIGGLKKLGAEGALTADRVFRAILKHGQPIEDAFAATNATIADSFTILNNAVTQYIGQTDKALGISKGFTDGMKLLATNFKDLADQILSSNGEVGRFIQNYNELRNILERATINKNKEQFKELWSVLTALHGALNDDTSALGVFGGAFDRFQHPFNAFLAQINLAIKGAIDLAKALHLIEDIEPPTQQWSEFAKNIQQPLLLKGPTFNAAQFTEAFKPDTKALEEFRQEVMKDFVQLGDLADAARQGQDAFDAMEDKIAAVNAVISKGILPTSELGQAYIQVIMATREVTRAFEGMIAAIEGTKTAQQQVGQQKLLALALSISAEEYRKLKDHIDLLNEAEQQNIDISSAQGQAWMQSQTQAKALEEELEKLRQAHDDIASTINSTVTSAIGSVASAFADAVVEGENFRDMLDALLKDLAKLAINAMMQLFLKQIIGGIGTTGAPGTGLLGGVGFHAGGIVGREGTRRSMSAIAFAGAPRFHGGLAANEFPAILKRGEGVFTPEQMKALGGGGTTVNIINQAPDTRIDQEQSRNASGGMDVAVYIRQAVTKEVSDPASSVHRSLKQTFGLSQAQARR